MSLTLHKTSMDFNKEKTGDVNVKAVENTANKEFTDMVNIFIQMIWLMSKRFGDVYIFGSIARMIATNVEIYHPDSDIDVYVSKNIGIFIKEIKQMIKMFNLFDKKNLVFTKLTEVDVTTTRYSNSEHYICKLNYLDEYGKQKSIPIDIVTGIVHPPINSWEIFELREQGYTIRNDIMLFDNTINFMSVVKQIMNREVLVFSSVSCKNLEKTISRFKKLLIKYPDISFVPSWEHDDKLSKKRIIPISITKLQEDTCCCICREKVNTFGSSSDSGSGSDNTNEQIPYLLKTHCTHLMCFNCISRLIENTPERENTKCPMCRRILH